MCALVTEFRRVLLRSLPQLLAAGKAYVKLSAPHRISALPDYGNVAPIARTFVEASPHQVIWGSDWPHAVRPAGRAYGPSAAAPFRPEAIGRASCRESVCRYG